MGSAIEAAILDQDPAGKTVLFSTGPSTRLLGVYCVVGVNLGKLTVCLFRTKL